MQVAGFTGHQYKDSLTPHQSQAKPTTAIHHADLFLLIFPPCIKQRRTHFYRLVTEEAPAKAAPVPALQLDISKPLV
jgi:hypothetical protein